MPISQTHITAITSEMNTKYVQNANVKVPIEQTSLWQKFDQSIAGRRPLGFYAYMNGNKPLAVFTMTLYTQRGYNWIWIKHGPVWLSDNIRQHEDFVKELKSFVAKNIRPKPCFIRLNLTDKTANAKLPLQHTMYEKTIVIDLRQSLEQIQAGMSQSGRRDLRKALKNSLVTKEMSITSAKDFRPFYNILQETAQRDGFGSHPASLYLNMLSSLPDNARLFAVYPKKEPKNVLAWAIITVYKGSALYYYGASSQAARQNFAPYKLHWDIMQTLKTEGTTSYDFMGIASKNYPGLKNVSVFKEKFSKQITEVSPTYDIVLQPTRYHALKVLYKLRGK
jgi:hypothetical protein